MTDQMDERFAAALREILLEQVQAAPVSDRWLDRQRHRLAVGLGITALAVSGGGIAYATGVFSSSLPGQTITTTLGTTVTFTETGTHTLNLGPRPGSANGVSISLHCLSVGTFIYPGGDSESCNTPRDIRQASTESVAANSFPLDPDQTTITIKSTPGARWRVSASYVTLTGTAWKTNASGQSYGVENQHGTPDLVAVMATNHRDGYAYENQLQGPTPTSPAQAAASDKLPARIIPVYEPDGKTQIGTFDAGN
jgi:hypothetical protein